MGYMNYEERLEVAKRLYELSNDEQKTALECIFPELCESDDEKIRKILVEAVTQVLQDQYCSNRGVSKEKVVAWLEKQANHANFRNKIQIGDKVTRNKDGVLVNLSQLNRVAKKDENQGESYTKKDVDDAFVEGMAFAKNELEKQSEQKLPIEKLPSEMKTIGESLGFTTQEECDEYNQMVSDLIMSDNDKVEPKFKVGDIVRKKDGDGLEWTVLSAENNNCYKIANEDYDNVVFLDDTWEVVEQVPIWSKEDERILKGILGYIGHGQHYGVSNSEMLTWLKSLKERIGE